MDKREVEQLDKKMTTLSNSDNKNIYPFDDAGKLSYRYSEDQPQRTIASISVKDFGAIGDGKADDSPAFQAAIDVIKEKGGGTLIIPQGEYWISQAVFLCDNITIIGTGWPTLRKKDGDHGYTVFAIYGVTIGNDKQADPEVKAPISEIPPQGCQDIIIDGNIFEGFNGNTKNESLISILGVQDTPDVTKNVRITGNIFHDTGGSDAIQIKYASDISVTGNSVMERNFRFVGVSGTQRLNIEGNCADKSEQQPVWITDTSHITYSKNKLRSFTKPPRFLNCRNVNITGNHFLDSEVASGIAFVIESCSEFNAYGNFANTTQPMSDAAIVFKNIPKRGLVHHNIFTGYLHAAIGESTNVLVSDNVV
ncbi:hypothetical protein J14TS2_19300 [Bacillus sp. J14TS2]|uniref:glycosyl hydrolase family 28-related protein n=1 Tax=Bacillus sp. J14TS2 TaxID=2807188 RepID=UPI001B0E3429|nr:glycosyl hydrolase family 28-related protein [Bacillus sp. J14TS2]GIN71455.1 hypothetical protein J14TS2_19300 [Bacillus sp. J14TS2]